MWHLLNPNVVLQNVSCNIDVMLLLQFYDHYMELGLKESISKLVEIRKRNGISNISSVAIKAAESDLYLAMVDDKVIMKIGPKLDVGTLVPSNFALAYSGIDCAVWEKQ